MPAIPKFLSRPVQGIGAAGNWLWNGRFDVPEWLYGSKTRDKPGSLNEVTSKELLKKNQPRVNKEAQNNIAKAYKKLGLSYDRAKEDPDYVDRAFQQAREKLSSAGAEIPEDASIHDLAAAYDKLDDKGKKAYSDPKAAPSSAGTGAEGTPAGQQTGGAQLANGKKVGSGADAPVAPRQLPSGNAPKGLQTPGGTIRPRTGESRADTPAVGPWAVAPNNQGARDKIARIQNNMLGADEVATGEARKDALSVSQLRDVDRLQANNWERLRQDENRYNLEQARGQFRERQRADMMEKRYRNRSFRDADDWKNLGTLREGEKMLDQKDYDARVGDLVKRARKLRTAEGRAGLGSADLRDMDMVFKTVGKLPTTKDDKGNVSYGGDLTPAQIEALGNRISGFESRAKASQARTAVQAEAFNRRAADKYRQQYGLDGFSDEDVLAFHEKRAAKTANDALDRMMKYGRDLEDKREADGPDADTVAQYEKDWDVIRGNVNVTDVFNRAMEDQATKDKFMSDMADIGTGPGADIKQEGLRRTAILNQMLKERRQPTEPRPGTDPDADAAAAYANPGVQPPGTSALPPAQNVAAPGLPPQPVSATPPVPPKKKKEETGATNAALDAGVPLRPRARR